MLVITPEPGLRHLLKLELHGAGIPTATAARLDEAATALAQTPSLIMVDSGLLRTGEALRSLETMRAGAFPIPVLLLVGEEMDGADLWRFDVDDYIVLPANASCIKERARALLRRHTNEEAPLGRLQWGDALTIDFGQHRAVAADRQVRLSQPEWRLLQLLATAHDGGRVSAHDLLIGTWGPAFEQDSEMLAAWMERLRRCLEGAPSAPRIILGDLTHGYALAGNYTREATELEGSVRR